jgi:hypothetical protein
MLEFVMFTVPPYVASTPRELFESVMIVTWSKVAIAFSPNANTPLAPEALVVMVLSTMLSVEALPAEYLLVWLDEDTSTPALVP